MLPVVRELETEYEGRVKFEIIDYYNDANKPILSQYAVRGHPSFVILKRDGTASETLRGRVEKGQFMQLLDEALG